MSHRAHNGKLMACDLLALADERPAPVATRVGFGEWGLGSSQVRARVDLTVPLGWPQFWF